jgi:hypothetical protein
VLWKGGRIIVIYTDDTIITGNNVDEIDRVIGEINQRFNITSEDCVNDFIAVIIEQSEQGI